MKASRGVLLVALALLAAAALRDVARLGDALPWRQLYDFAEFYCAGAALDAGADPYRYEPLHRCEHAVDTGSIYRNDPARVTPAPLPPYDFPPFMLAARLSYGTARQFDAVAIVAAVIAAIVAMGALVPLEATALAMLLPAGYVLLNAGQVVPFALAALVFCGLALARGRDAFAGVLGALVTVEPHLGLPVCIALLLWLPRSRAPLVATAVVLLAIGASTVGIATTFEYVSRVLPAQAAAEIASRQARRFSSATRLTPQCSSSASGSGAACASVSHAPRWSSSFPPPSAWSAVHTFTWSTCRSRFPPRSSSRARCAVTRAKSPQ
jgi:hypothetical protein